jgi:PAS domain S-box-containing protein
MAESRPPQSFHLEVLGDDRARADWSAVVGDRPARRRPGGEDLPQRSSDALLVTLSARDLAGRAADLATAEKALVVLAHEGPGVHPFTALVKAIALAKQEWEAAVDALPDAVVIVDSEGRVRRANRAFAALVGCSFSEILGHPVETLVGTTEPDQRRLVDLGRPEGRVSAEEARFSRIPGCYLVTTSPLGGANEVAAILKDVTAAKEQQRRQELAHRLADVGRLAGGVAHEISTPLASIALRAESLLRRVNDPQLQSIEALKDMERYLGTIVEETFRCKRIIGALLEFSRVRQPEIAPADLNALVETAVALVGDQMRAKRVDLETRLEPALKPMPLDAAQIREALVALLLNALDASAAGGRVTVETRLAGEAGVDFTVADEGSGIPAEDLDKIFVPFFTTKPVGQGVGLGLSICDGIVKSHGGEIDVDTTPGTGTRVTVRLPGTRLRPGATGGLPAGEA